MGLVAACQAVRVVYLSVWDWLSSDKGQLALAGLAGSAVNAVMEWQGARAGVRKLFVGCTTAYFLGPVGVPLFTWAGGAISLPPDQSSSVGAFLMGVSGVVVIEIIMRVWQSRKEQMDGK